MFDFVCLLSVPFYRYSLSVCLVEYTVMMHTQNKRSKYTLVVIFFFSISSIHCACVCNSFDCIQFTLCQLLAASIRMAEQTTYNNYDQKQTKYSRQCRCGAQICGTHIRAVRQWCSVKKKKTSTWENASKAKTYTHSALFANAVKLTRCWVEYRLLSTHGASASACLRQTIRCHTIPSL